MLKLKLFPFLSLVVACGSGPEGAKNKMVRTAAPVDTNVRLTLAAEWRYSTRYSGVFMDSRSGEEFFFVGDPSTHMTMRVFDSQGNLVLSIPLVDADAVLGRINSMTMASKDTILVLDDRGERLAKIDKLGDVVRLWSLHDHRCDEHDDLYELYPTNSGLTRMGSKLYLGPALLGTCNGKPYYERTSSELLNAQRYYALATGGCQLAEIDLDATIGGVRFGARGILGHLTNIPRKTLGMSYTAIANGKLFLFSEYSPFVHEIDTSNLTVSRKVPITYMYGDVGITPPPISEEGLKRDSANILREIKAYVLSFTYDQPSGHYLATVVHELPDDAPKEDPPWWRNWSLVVLDSAYNKVSEYVLSGKEYSGSVLLSTKSGTWVLKRDPDPQAFMKPKVFHRLRVP